MNIDKTRECVRSKYFVAKAAMEESLSDFQESKSNCKGPKTSKKEVKPKTRKVRKHIKGQKDIRTALKGKKNDLVSYTKEFNNVCKKSGVDVDSEQLQLAIALSRSLQTESADASTSQTLTTQARVAKIRTTLREYGFAVPDIKVNTTNKRIKKFRKQFKLLNTTEEEKLSTIRYKYSAILAQSLDCKESTVSTQELKAPIYNKASNLEYKFMKSNEVFYVDSLANLIERSNPLGSLLRDWSEIPGRPVSPVLFDRTAMDISEIVCSQDELDIILSGPILSAHKVIATKVSKHDNSVCDTNDVVTVIENRDECNREDNIDQEISCHKNRAVESPDIVITKYDDTDKIDTVTTSHSTDIVQYRSCSPDIFDDEMISINEISKPVLSQEEKTKLFTEDTNCMEITECVLVNNIVNTTKRKSDDFMEITECAVTASQGIKENVKEIDLTQSPEEKSVLQTRGVDDICVLYNDAHLDCEVNKTIVTADDSPDSKNNDKNLEHVDLTQTFFEDNNKTLKNNSNISCQDSIEKHFQNEHPSQRTSENIDLTQSSNEDETKKPAIEVTNEILTKDTNIDLTQSSKSSIDICDLPEVNVGNTQNSLTSPDDTVILNEDEYIDANGKVKKSIVKENDQVFDLTQAGDMSLEEQPNSFTKERTSNLCSQSFYEDFVHDHSDNKENKDDFENVDNNFNVHNRSKESNDIDLTQSSNESTKNSVSPRPMIAIETPDNSSLGKKDDMSIDYDEICEQTVNNSLNVSKSKISNDVEIVDKDNDLISNSSQFSEVFDLADQELNYSIHKSKHNDSGTNFNYDFGEISEIEIIKSDSLDPSLVNKSSEENNLPEVIIDSSQKCVQDVHQTDEVSIQTPKNNEYIVKTDGVTPMLDYSSLTTPQRNKELDKYGLKPFKRKRAIQILTHLYNQTHPIVEPCSDDEPSASKKPKHDFTKPLNSSQSNETSPKPIEIDKNIRSPRKKSGNDPKSPSKNVRSPKKGKKSKSPILSLRNEGSSKETLSAYEITTEVPNIRDIDVDPEDWVFQKREKAKVHSCKVPLHIAFHNYVSSRRNLREAILKYEPINIDDIHKELVLYGHRYDPKDLLRFLDKKCITVKTTDNNNRNKR